MSTKEKGLLKGLRYISQMFDNEKRQEIQIGNPTDVKHVAHIGWDGPSTNSAPAWMTEFKSSTGVGVSTAPLGSSRSRKEDGTSSVSSKDIPKSSKRQSSSGTTTSSVEPTTKLKPEKSKQSRKSSKGSQSPARDLADGATPARSDIPKKNPKKSKDSSAGGASRSSTRSKGQSSSLADESTFLDTGHGSVPLSVTKDCNQVGMASKLDGVEDEKAITSTIL
ncbi:hypothetical protein SAY86_032236 [Trapa natans]|uniref:CRIB domain-containing protein n=1 Tax=Trapa natans TaxID=22666 RepID=A0AAN7RAH2_TRANT|nr:hypothetical protein SAY86_032236 [Trapa natans]